VLCKTGALTGTHPGMTGARERAVERSLTKRIVFISKVFGRRWLLCLGELWRVRCS
jgi:hypothetical protein